MGSAAIRLSLLPLLLVLFGCGTPANTTHEVQFAHFPGERSMSGPLGQLISAQIGFETDFSPLQICIENHSSLANDDLITEVRLSYGAWLANVPEIKDSDWQKLNFTVANLCDETKSHSIVRVAKAPAEVDQTSRFKPQEINCHRDDRFKRCQISSLTLGVGRPGALTMHYYRNEPDRWFGLSHHLPSLAEFNPFVNWYSLQEEILQTNGLDAMTKELLLAAYDEIKNQGDAVTLGMLDAFVKELEQANLQGREDLSYEDILQDFYDSDAITLNQTFQPARSLFGTLLHEVGHQFGMDHADNPSLDSITGGDGTATQNDSGQWISKDARMAYGDPMLFLTPDDQAGVRSNANHIRTFLKDHHLSR